MTGCGHCGYRGDLEKSTQVVAKTTTDHVEPYGDVDWQEFWALYRCPNCGRPTLETYGWSDVFSDPESVPTTRLFPSPRSYSSVPADVRKEIEAGQLVKSMNPGLYAVCVRRSTAICAIYLLCRFTHGAGSQRCQRNPKSGQPAIL